MSYLQHPPSRLDATASSPGLVVAGPGGPGAVVENDEVSLLDVDLSDSTRMLHWT
ncbi:MAG: hypothetical protein ABIP03_11305 [Aquihabitans sp.]